MDWIRYGPNAVLLRFAQKADESAFLLGRAWLAELERDPPEGLIEIVPAFTTVLLLFSGRSEADRGWDRWSRSTSGPQLLATADPGRSVELVVRYGGLDLDRVAARARMTVAEVIRAHCAPWYRVHCLGFSPGFPYLGGLDSRLSTPRLDTPRVQVPAGSVAIGGEQTGIYSIASPGGWNLIGTTLTPMFRPDAASIDEAFFLRAGDRVRFLDAGSEAGNTGEDLESNAPSTAPVAQADPGGAAFRIHSIGVGISVQDGGRPGYQRFGVPPGGAMDSHAAAWANRLLDNPPEAPVLELCLQGQRIEILEDGWLAWTGGDGGGTTLRKPWSAFRVRAGEIHSFPASSTGVWSYLAIPGGFVGPRFLGSVSANPRAGMGAMIRDGAAVCRNADFLFTPPSALVMRRPVWTELPSDSGMPEFPVWPGPQWDSFSPACRDLFFSSEWVVSPQSDRVGYRLQGPVLPSPFCGMISEPVLPGSIQVPPSGQPIVTMPDGPTLGGYPKIGVLEPAIRARLAQCRPGRRVRFVPVT